MDSQTTNIDDIVQDAVDAKSVDPTAADAAKVAVEAVQGGDTGVSTEGLEVATLFLTQALFDDSGSMDDPQWIMKVRTSFESMKEELILAEEEAEEDMVVLLMLEMLNRGLVQPYCETEDAVDLNDTNHICDGGTPLCKRMMEFFGNLLHKISEVQQAGQTAQTFSIIFGDGGADDENDPLPNSDGGMVTYGNAVSKLIRGLNATKQHIICAVAIDPSARSTFERMGIDPNWIIDASKPFEFESAMRKVSRASRSASRGAGAFQNTAEKGLG